MVITRDGEFVDWEDVLEWFIWISPKLRNEVAKEYEDETISGPLNDQMQAFRRTSGASGGNLTTKNQYLVLV